MNASGLFAPPLPPLDPNHGFVYMNQPTRRYNYSYAKAVMDVVSGGANIEYRDAWAANLTAKNWVCFKRAVATGAIAGVVSGPRSDCLGCWTIDRRGS